MVKNHLKRLAVPRTWDIKKKKRVFITRPNPGGLAKEYTVPLIVLFRDMMKRAKTVSEMKYILQKKEILRNGRRQKDHKAPVGLMDVITIPEIKQSFRLLLNTKGKLVVVKIDDAEANLFPCKIRSKSINKGGKVQLNFTNGVNIFVEKDTYKTGDVIVMDFKKKKIAHHFKLEKGAVIYLTGGKHIGESAKVEDIKDDKLLFKNDSKEVFETSKDYAFAIGKDKAIIKLEDGKEQ